jgi:hypothetical protein
MIQKSTYRDFIWGEGFDVFKGDAPKVGKDQNTKKYLNVFIYRALDQICSLPPPDSLLALIESLPLTPTTSHKHTT